MFPYQATQEVDFLKDNVLQTGKGGLSNIALLHRSKSRTEIARQMKISDRTVDVHIAALIQKLGVKSKIGLAVYVERNKLY